MDKSICDELYIEYCKVIAERNAMLEMLKVLASSTAVLNHLDADTNQALCDLIARVSSKCNECGFEGTHSEFCSSQTVPE